MSDPADRDTAAHPVTEGRARSSLKQLRIAYGFQGGEGDVVVRLGMNGKRETWRRLYGTGSSAVYELEEKEG